MFAPVDLAVRLDRAEGRLCAGIARVVGRHQADVQPFVRTVAGGTAIYAGPGSPMNKLIGAAYGVVPDEAEIADLEAAYAERGVAFQAEVSTLAEPAFAQMLLRHGYLLRGYENQLGRRLTPTADGDASAISIELVDRGHDVFERWIEMLATGFATLDVGGVGGDVVLPPDEMLRWLRVSVEVEGHRCYLARWQGEPAGAGTMNVHDGVAILCGASTLPAFRRRGIQTTLLRARLNDAARLGCDYATVTVQPGSKSQQNAQREGFALLYSRALLVREK